MKQLLLRVALAIKPDLDLATLAAGMWLSRSFSTPETL
jgi:hypothetical protein